VVVVVVVVVVDLRLWLIQATRRCDRVIGSAQMKTVQTSILHQGWFAEDAQ